MEFSLNVFTEFTEMIPLYHRDTCNRADPYIEPNSCFSDFSDSLDLLKVLLHLGKTPLGFTYYITATPCETPLLRHSSGYSWIYCVRFLFRTARHLDLLLTIPPLLATPGCTKQLSVELFLLKNTNQLILISSNCNENSFGKDKCSKLLCFKALNWIASIGCLSSNDVDSWLVLVHRIQNNLLQKKERKWTMVQNFEKKNYCLFSAFQ